jgi:hypothetical protein
MGILQYYMVYIQKKLEIDTKLIKSVWRPPTWQFGFLGSLCSDHFEAPLYSGLGVISLTLRQTDTARHTMVATPSGS